MASIAAVDDRVENRLMRHKAVVTTDRFDRSSTALRPLDKGGGALCAGNAVALLVFGPVMP